MAADRATSPARTVRLVDVPVATYLDLHAHNDAMLREFDLVAIARSDDGVRRLAEAIHTKVTGLWSLAPEAQQAAERGEPFVTLEFPADDPLADAIEEALVLMEQADERCRSGALLTEPTPEELVRLRRWIVTETVAQVRHGAPPRPFPQPAGLAAHEPRTRPGAAAIEARYRSLIDHIDAIVWEATLDPVRFTFVSDRVVDLLGYPAERILDDPKFWFEITHPDDRPSALTSLDAISAGRLDGASIEVRALAADGRVVWLRNRAHLVRDGRGRPLLVRGLMLDVTKEHETATRREAIVTVAHALAGATTLSDAVATLLEAVVRGMDWDVGAMWVLPPPGAELACVGTWARPDVEGLDEFIALTKQRRFRPGVGLPGRVWESNESIWVNEVSADPQLPRGRVAAAAGLRSGAAFPILVRGQARGVIEFFSLGPRPFDADVAADIEVVSSQLGTFVERRRAEEDERFQRALFEAESEASIDAIVVVSLDGRILSYNHRFVELAGVDPELMAAGDAQALLDQLVRLLADPDQFLRMVEDVRAHPDRPVRRELVHRDGRVFDCYIAHLPDDHGGYFGRGWYLRDITDRKRTEEAYRSLSETLQQSLLPPELPAVPGVELAARYHFARGGGEVGGDFYDVFRTGNAWGVMIGDVGGKGPEAAAVTALTRYTARAAAAMHRRPRAILGAVNDAILRQGGDRLSTMAYARLEQRAAGLRVVSASGGHPLPVIVRVDGTIETLGTPGLLLGAFSDAHATDATTELHPGDALVLFTDGVPEARRGKEFFGLDALYELLAAMAGARADEIADRITDAAIEFHGGTANDDVAVVVVRVRD